MKLSKRGALVLMAEEAISLGAYKDSGGVWTIGIGHTAAAGLPEPKAGLQLTLSTCIEIFRRDVEKFENRVSQAIKIALTQHEFDALVLFDFNTGAISVGSIDDKMNSRNISAALATWEQYTKAGGKKLQGLVDRRAREIAMFVHAEYSVRAILLYTAYPKGKSVLNPNLIPWSSEAPKPIADKPPPDVERAGEKPPADKPVAGKGVAAFLIGLIMAAIAAAAAYFAGGN